MASKKITGKGLNISGLRVTADGEEILKGVDLAIKAGEIHVVMGPNGSGKSTLCNTVMGHPFYKVTGGKIVMDGNDVAKLKPDKRAHAGIFLGFQYPREVAGVTFGNFMRIAVNTVNKARNKSYMPIGPAQFYPLVQNEMQALKMNKKFIGRCLNEGFSGGEKKRAEIVQMLLLKPKIAILDEIDSGLDVDGLKAVAEGISRANKENGSAVLLITHYARILKYLKPDFVHVMSDGKIVKSGKASLAGKIEREGYIKYE